MKRYESYKPSGISWIGEIPSHWEVKPINKLLDKINNPAKDYDKKIGLENIESWSGKFIETDSIFDGAGPHFDINDILYGKLRPYLAKVWVTTFEGQAVGDFYVFKSKNGVNPYFINFHLLNPSLVYLLDSYTYGAKMPRVKWEDMGKTIIPIPSEDEQEKIVEFLSSKTLIIDAQQRERERVTSSRRTKTSRNG